MHGEQPVTIRGLVAIVLTEVLIFGCQQLTGMFSGWPLVAVGVGGLLAMNFEKKGDKRSFWSTVLITLAVATGLTLLLGRKLAPPPPVAAKQAQTWPLKYQACGGFSHTSDFKLAEFIAEIDPINPNSIDRTYVIKRGTVVFDGRVAEIEPTSPMVVVPRAEIVVGVTKRPAIETHILFNPPIIGAGEKTGTYHLEIRYGADENSMTTPAELSGTMFARFDGDGVPTLVSFRPSSNRNISFDPGEGCDFRPEAKRELWKTR